MPVSSSSARCGLDPDTGQAVTSVQIAALTTISADGEADRVGTDTSCINQAKSLSRSLPESRGKTLLFQHPGERDTLLSPECRHTVADPIKIENPVGRITIFSAAIRSPARRAAEFHDFAAIEAFTIR